MWVPKDVYALPTELEIILANEAIQELEAEWRKVWLKVHINPADTDDFFDLMSGETRLKELKREIYNYKAWIAPIRRLPEELLSEIFIAHAQLDCFAPSTDGAVCRFWRHVVLSTPRAWCYIDLDRFRVNKRGLSVWIDRCASADIHLATNCQTFESRRAVIDYCSVVSTLTLGLGQFTTSSLWYTFPKLRTLRIKNEGTLSRHDVDNMIEVTRSNLTCLIDSDRFPSLRCLHLDSPGILLPPFISTAKSLPPLQKLILSNIGDLHSMEQKTTLHMPFPAVRSYPLKVLMSMVQRFAGSLRTLEMSFSFLPHIYGKRCIDKVTLPLLEELTYQLGAPDPYAPCKRSYDFPITLHTPRLRKYCESQNHYPSPLHQDTKSVTELWLQASIAGASEFYVPDFSVFPLVDTIVTNIQRQAALELVLDSLDRHPEMCPKLHTIHHYSHPFDGADIPIHSYRVGKLKPRLSSSNQAQMMEPVVLYHTSLFPIKHVQFSQEVARRPEKDTVALLALLSFFCSDDD